MTTNTTQQKLSGKDAPRTDDNMKRGFLTSARNTLASAAVVLIGLGTVACPVDIRPMDGFYDRPNCSVLEVSDKRVFIGRDSVEVDGEQRDSYKGLVMRYVEAGDGGVERITISTQHPEYADNVVEIVPEAGEGIDVEIPGCGVKITGRISIVSSNIGVTVDNFTITNTSQEDAGMDGSPDAAQDADGE
ncbi:hypothetical protein KKF81_05885 [Candidatus Micrarchaeota archaeon]|nr:hypothetical protein [Candidatus Micrarchaeota archaeon]MBU1166459.1 hypothetical protein [Candidatus Micrarchaeota archaeon]MBU1886534.1 hypothetical protein [Candidatus Micrarchaeota archaeon]